MINLRDAQCSDRRDRVYALLGLLPEITIQADYTKPHVALFREVATSHVHSPRSRFGLLLPFNLTGREVETLISMPTIKWRGFARRRVDCLDGYIQMVQ